LVVIVFTSPQVVGELRSQQIGVDDPGWLVRRNGNQFEQASVPVRPDHEESFLPVLVVLDKPDRVVPGVLDVRIRDSVLAR